MGSFRAISRTLAMLAALAALAGSSGQAEAATRGPGAPGGAPVRPDGWIAAEAEYLSGRQLTVVCSVNTLEWSHALAAAGLRSAAADQYYGFSLIVRGEMHLSPYVCEGLRLGENVSTRRRNELQVAWSVNVLIHESVHMGRLSTDEALTEACTRVSLPVELHRLYMLAYRSAELARLTLAATWFRRTQSRVYQGGSCPPVG